MRKIAIVLLMFTVMVSGLLAETIYEAPFLPVSPEVMAQGGSYLAKPDGYSSLFYNPAGFVMTDELGKLTLLSETVWTYMNPATAKTLIESFSQGDAAATQGEAVDMIQLLNDQVTSGGFGVGMSVGAGWVGHGLGIGGALVFDSSLYGGRNILDMSGDLHVTLGGVFGYALELELLGINFNIGADIRPMYRVHAILENEDAIQMFSSLASSNVEGALEVLNLAGGLTGVGVGLDAGVVAELGKLQVALSMRDIFGTRFSYTRNGFDVILEDLEAGNSIREGEAIPPDVRYVIPMDISAGAALNIDFLEPLLGLVVHGDIQDVVGVIRDKRSPWTLLHLGAEATLLKILKARAGFNQGYITLGAGAHLLFADVNVAVFTRELGQHIGDRPNSGMAVEIAIRF